MATVECDKLVRGCHNVMRLSFYDLDGEELSVTGERIRLAISAGHIDSPLLVKDSDVSGEIEIQAAPNDHQALVNFDDTDLDEILAGTYCRSVELTFNSLTPAKCTIPLIDMVDIVDSAFSGEIA